MRLLTASRGKIEGSRAIWIGTRPVSEHHPFAKMLAGDAGYSQVHAASESDNPFSVKTWRKANPSLDHMPDLLAVIRQEAELAKKDPSMLAAFRALRLNMGTSDVVEALLLDPAVWRRCEAVTAIQTGPYIMGVDLGSGQATSAVSAYFLETGRLEVFAAFPESPDLSERGRLDGVGRAYVDMYQREELVTAGQFIADVGVLLHTALERWGKPVCIVSDRWRENELREQLAKARFPMTGLVLRGQGFQDGAEDVRRLRRACLEGRVHAEEACC